MLHVCTSSQLEEDEEGGGLSGALMEVGGQEEQQEMAVVLHEVRGHWNTLEASTHKPFVPSG